MRGRAALINPPAPDSRSWVREGRCQQWDIWGAPFPPYSLAMISTQLKKAGLETLIIDSAVQNGTLEEVLAECLRFSPDLVFLTVASPTIDTDLGWFAPALKTILPSVGIVALGIHVSAFPREVLEEYGALDMILLGEPELTAREVALARIAGETGHGIDGLAWKDRAGEARINRRRIFIEDLDSLGFPDWAGLDLSLYRMPIKERPFSLIGFSRGCPFSCKFCAAHVYSGKKVRKRSVASLIEEIESNISAGVRDFLFWTELMTLDIAFLDLFLEAVLSKGLEKKIRWVCNSRVDSGSRAIYAKMKRAGCWQIAFGFEFGDDEILRLAEKGGRATTERGRQTAHMAADSGIAVSGHFMMGYPGETRESLRKTIDYACSLPLTFAHFYAATPFPGSALYDEARRQRWIRPGDERSLSQDQSVIRTKLLDPQTIQACKKQAYRTFYLSPGKMARIVMVPSSPRELFNLAKTGYRFYRSLARESS